MKFLTTFVYLTLHLHVLAAFSHSGIQTGNEDELVRRKRTFGVIEPPCNLTHGVYLERWDRIDYKRVKFLLKDPRYPNMPNFATCVPTFEQPSKWADFFGSRLRTYFVPLQTGNHYFYLSSNAGSKLFLSTDGKPDTKSIINYVDGGFTTYQYEYDRFTNQKSLPVYLKQGKFYYMEALMKDDHQNDHLEVAVKTPDGKFYNVIPSKFLWTALPPPPERNATYRAILLKIAARAGARAGLSFGAHWARKSGARAGAKAGTLAGMQAGAFAGARAGEKAAAQMAVKTIEDGLNNVYGRNSHQFKIVIQNGHVVSVTGGRAGSGGPGGIGGSGGTKGTGGSGVAGSVGGGGGAGGSRRAESAVGAEPEGGKAVGAGPSTSVAGKGGGSSSHGLGVTAGSQGQVGAGGGESTSEGTLTGMSVTGSQVTTSGGTRISVVPSSGSISGPPPDAFSKHQQVSYVLKPRDDAQTMARMLVWKQGGASKLVQDGLYTVHSWDIPYPQENGSLNFCWRSFNGKMAFRPFCQVFKVQIPALYQKVKAGKESASFESVCLPGYFLRQKNYNFFLQKRDGSELFGRKKHIRHSRALVLDFYNGDPDVLERCTFGFWPIPQYANKHKNCRNVAGPVVQRGIEGQPFPHPARLVPEAPSTPVPVQPSCIPVCSSPAGYGSTGLGGPLHPSVASGQTMCIALNFINNFGPSFKLHSSLKHEAYLVTGSGFKLKLMMERPDLHSHVTFDAEDPDGRSKILLNGEKTISEPIVPGCPVFKDVLVTEQDQTSQGMSGNYASLSPSTQTPTSTFAPHTPPLRNGPPAPPPLPPPPSLSPSPPPAPPPSPSPPSPPSMTPSSFVPSQQAAVPVAPASPVSGTPGTLSQRGNGHGSLHYHYHLHQAKTPLITPGCPSSCTPSVCRLSCPPHCCQ